MSSLLGPPSIFVPKPPPYPIYQLTVDEYHRMISSGILTEDNPVELLEGWLVPKMPHNPSHDATIQLTEEVIRPKLPPGWRLRVQSAITTPDSEPEPDLAIVAGDARTYLYSHPQPQDIAVLIEVSDSSLQRDREDKSRLYARARIACYWIINLIDRQVEVYTDATGPDRDPHFGHQQVYGLDSLISLPVGGQDIGPIAVRDLMP